MTKDPLQGIVAIGDVLAGKYRVERVLGVGGMGVVVAAMHLELDERVALKFLLPDALENTETVARFAREARAAVKIKSEHVARVTDVGKLENGAPYMVMEFLEGGDLSALLEKEKGLPIHEIVEYVLQACEAVAEAHALGIVHRDLKPANLFLARRVDGSACVKVLDFGISKMASGGPGGSSRDAAMTRTTAVMGSPLYMSPEQMASARNADPRSDIWALGAILYELTSGIPPFDGEGLPQLCTAILHGTPPRIQRSDLPAGFESAILRCLEKQPGARYQNVAELARALAPFGSASAATSAARIARVLGAAPPSAPQSSSYLTESSGRSEVSTIVSGAQTNASWGKTQPRASNGTTIAVVAGVLAIGAVLAGVLAMRGHGAPSAAQGQAPSAQIAPVVVVAATAAPIVAPATASATVDPAPAASTPAPAASTPPPVASARVKPATQAKVSHPAEPVKPKSLFGDRN